MPTRDEMNSCGVPFLALRRPEAIEDERAAYAAGQARAIDELTTKLVELGLRCQALEVAKRDAETRAGEWEMIAKAKSKQFDHFSTETLRLSGDVSVLNSLLEEQRRISKRLAGENERLREQVAMMADVQGPSACLGSAVRAWQDTLVAELSSVGGMAASMERVEVLGVRWDDAAEKATEPHTAAKASPAPSPQKIDFASHGAAWPAAQAIPQERRQDIAMHAMHAVLGTRPAHDLDPHKRSCVRCGCSELNIAKGELCYPVV
jgi:hypothetical protein